VSAAEDIAIDAFTDLVVHRHRYNFKVTLKTYLFMIGRSRALNYIKHRGNLSIVELSEAENCSDDSLSLDQFVMLDESKQALHKALTTLKPDLREVVILVYFQELSCQEAAKVLKKNVKQVYNLLYRAKEALRTILQQEGAFSLREILMKPWQKSVAAVRLGSPNEEKWWEPSSCRWFCAWRSAVSG
jgi:RNA polymerase sigma-70 factor (ECF subfamily)